MNAGLGNLTSLKAQLLAVSMQSQTNYDPIITAIGLGVARIDAVFHNSVWFRDCGYRYWLPDDRPDWD